MSTTADPQSHYFVQLNRRSSRLAEWREARRELAHGSDVQIVHSAVRRVGVGMLAGAGSELPTRMIDARILELTPGRPSSTHRHMHDAVLFVLEGEGFTTIGGQRIAWRRWDALHTPTWVWHQHTATGSTPARLLALTDAPLVRALRLARLQDVGDGLPPAEPAPPAHAPDEDVSAYRYDLLDGDASAAVSEGRLHTAFTDVTLRVNPKGTRTALLVDGSLGYRTSGLSIAMFQIAPGMAQSNHRHPGEAFLYVVSGRGYSVVDGRRYDWGSGDLVCVHQYVWHQHFNADPDNPAIVLRIHMWESMIDIMQCAMDPVPLYEDDHAMVQATSHGGVWTQRTPDLDEDA